MFDKNRWDELYAAHPGRVSVDEAGHWRPELRHDGTYLLLVFRVQAESQTLAEQYAKELAPPNCPLKSMKPANPARLPHVCVEATYVVNDGIVRSRTASPSG